MTKIPISSNAQVASYQESSVDTLIRAMGFLFIGEPQ
jgi:hypothetical protein